MAVLLAGGSAVSLTGAWNGGCRQLWQLSLLGLGLDMHLQLLDH